MDGVRDFTLADVNRDSLPDVITLDYKNKKGIVMLMNTGNPANLFEADTIQVDLPGAYSSFALTDLGGNAGYDIVAGYEQANGVSLLTSGMGVNDTWSSEIIPVSYGIAEKVLAGDLDGDSDIDIVQLLDDNGFLIYRNGIISSVENEAAIEEVSIFPNPSNGILNVSAPSAIHVLRIIGPDGREMPIDGSGQGSDRVIRTSAYPTGMYILEARMDRGLLHRERFVVLH
jgi:hypothetical protein